MSSTIEKHKILVVDGSDSILELIESMLEGEDCEVITRNSFEKGLEYIKSNKQVPLVLSDHCKKSGRNGLKFLDQVSIHSPKTIKVLTTCCLQNSELECQIKSGTIHSYIARPFKISEILGKIKSGLKQYEENIQEKTVVRSKKTPLDPG